MTPSQQQAIDKILALQELTRSTGTRTTRAVNSILQALSDDDLTVVAMALKNASALGGAR
jgi:hypothetical protein